MLLELFIHFALMSCLALGGISATLPEMYRQLVEVHGWISPESFTALYALSQAAPGPNVLFVALFGWQIAGWSGLMVSMLGICLPASALALAFDRLTQRHAHARWPSVVRQTLAPVSVGLLLCTGWLLAGSVDHAWIAMVFTALCVVLSLMTPLHPLWLIVVGASLGAVGVI
jgi:chromate transporter